jgi:DNA invertase Pin-like site-specific DNA recombinase
MSRKTGRRPIDPRLRQWVRTMYRLRAATQTELAKFLGCSQATVHRMISYG